MRQVDSPNQTAANQGAETVLILSRKAKSPQVLQLEWILPVGGGNPVSIICHDPSDFAGIAQLNCMGDPYPSILYVFDGDVNLCSFSWDMAFPSLIVQLLLSPDLNFSIETFYSFTFSVICS